MTGQSAVSQDGKHLLEGRLYVSGSTDSGGLAAWEPFHFTHHKDGSVSFRPLKGICNSCNVNGNLTYGDLSGVQLAGSGAEYFLDADWRQPFVAAPWKPLARPAGFNLKDSLTGELFPFTVSYAPARPQPGDTDSVITRRRTLVLAAHSARVRSKWLATLARKAHAPELRSNAFASRPATSAASRRRIAALGQEHCGLPSAVGFGGGRSSSLPRLPAGPAGLWDSHSSLRIVRDLYDGYAADPLAQDSPGKHSFAEDSDSSSASQPAKASKHHRVLKKYIERQAEIESLLDKKLTNDGTTDESPTELELTRPASPIISVRERMIGGEETANNQEEAATELSPLLGRLQVAAKTTNVTFEGGILSNESWSGAAIFSPPDERSFRLTISPLDDLEERPLFLGLAPPDANLSMVNFFSSGGGIFLCIGGRASDELISALGAPSGPSLFCFGERHIASLPKPESGQNISVHYTESGRGGDVRFLVSSREGAEIASYKPRLRHGLPLGPWRPCVLMCMPSTRVWIVRLI